MDLPRGHSKDHYQPYPFNLGYLVSVLKDVGVNAYGLDACAEDFTDDAFIQFVSKFRPDHLYVEVPTICYPMMHRVLTEIKTKAKCRITVFGSHASARPQDFKDFEVKRGIYPQGDIDKLPFPDRESFPIEDYHDFEFHKPAVHMLSSRGCPMSCSFCLQRHVIYGSNRYEMRSAESIVDEMELCENDYGAKQAYFDDDTMTVQRDHIEAFCNEILFRGVEMPWTCMGDLTIDYKTLILMRKAGCIGIKFGVDSINPMTLFMIGKHFVNTGKAKRFVENCSNLGIWSHATYVIGLPYDTKDNIEDMIMYAINLGSDSCQFSIATPFPGTPFYQQCKDHGWLITDDWTRYDGARSSVVNYPWLGHEEIDALFQHAMNIRKKYNLNMREKIK